MRYAIHVFRGGHPSEKTERIHMVIVQDTFGNKLHETYEKRAKGLVKKGRAFYVDEQTICLIQPAMEESNMEYNVTLQDLLTRLDTIVSDKGHMHEAMQLMERLPYDLSEEETNIRSTAIMNMVKEREETNRKAIDLLETMYEDLKIV